MAVIVPNLPGKLYLGNAIDPCECFLMKSVKHHLHCLMQLPFLHKATLTASKMLKLWF